MSGTRSMFEEQLMIVVSLTLIQCRRGCASRLRSRSRRRLPDGRCRAHQYMSSQSDLSRRTTSTKISAKKHKIATTGKPWKRFHHHHQQLPVASLSHLSPRVPDGNLWKNWYRYCYRINALPLSPDPQR